MGQLARCCSAMAVVAALLVEPAAAQASSIAVLPFSDPSNVAPRPAGELTAALITNLRDSGRFSKVLSPDDLDKKLGAAVRQNLTAMLMDPTAIVDGSVLGLLGVDLVLHGSMAAHADGTVLSVRLIEARSGKAHAARGPLTAGGQEAAALVWTVLAEVGIRAPVAAAVEQPAAAPLAVPEPVRASAPWRLPAAVVAGAAGAFALTSVLLAGAAAVGAALWTLGLRERSFVAAVPSWGLRGTPRFAALWAPVPLLGAMALVAMLLVPINLGAAGALAGAAWKAE